MVNRLDLVLVERGIVASRSRARDLILRGFVEVNGALVSKPAASVSDASDVKLLSETPMFVSRGAEKLIAILDHCGLDPSGCRALDIGASTGGFTEVLLQRGAREVVCVDVGHDQLSVSLRDRAAVLNLEGVDARDLTLDRIGGAVDVIVADVSFISLLKVLPAVFGLCRPGGWFAGLVKPQFEVGRQDVGKGGIVSNVDAQQAAVDRVLDWIGRQPGWLVLDVIGSPVRGGSGNQEFLVGARRND